MDIDTWKTLRKITWSTEWQKRSNMRVWRILNYLNILRKTLIKSYRCDPEACEYISERNCNVKYQVVMKDEKEKSLREILNLGHTVGRY